MLLDREHVLTELYAITNVPTVVWVDEENNIVRPNSSAFGTDTFKEFTGVDSSIHKDAIRRWVVDGEIALSDDQAKESVADLDDDALSARLHYRIALHLLRSGNSDGALAHFATADQLAPYDFTIRRAAMPLTGRDPFGDEFFALYAEYEKAGTPFNGISR